MYKILIVDDEELICQGIESMIGRMEHLQIEEIHMAYDGAEGERLFRLYSPDIVITDVCMPVMNGLDMIKGIKETGREVPIIILSGFGEFQYVKEAFTLGAKDYLLKPASKEELEHLLDNIINELKRKTLLQAGQQEKQKQYRLAMLENCLRKLFTWDQIAEANLRDGLDEIRLILPHDFLCIVLIQCIQNGVYQDPGEKVAQMAVSAYYKEFLKSHTAIHAFQSNHHETVLLINFKDRNSYQDILCFFRQFIKRMNDIEHDGLFTAISSIGEGMEAVSTLYRQVREVMNYIILYNPGDLIPYSSIEDKRDCTVIDQEQIKVFKNDLKEIKNSQVSNFIDHLFNREKLKDVTISSMHGLYLSILLAVGEVYHDTTGTVRDILKRDFSSFQSIADLRIFLKEEIGKLLTTLKEEHNGKDLIGHVKKYIHENFHRNIDMTMAANSISMSYTYFSKYFKDETGENFSEYLNRIRMEEAIKLLDSPLYKIYEVSSRVGFENPKYFTRIFHQYYGMSPRDYQRRLGYKAAHRAK